VYNEEQLAIINLLKSYGYILNSWNYFEHKDGKGIKSFSAVILYRKGILKKVLADMAKARIKKRAKVKSGFRPWSHRQRYRQYINNPENWEVCG